MVIDVCHSDSHLRGASQLWVRSVGCHNRKHVSTSGLSVKHGNSLQSAVQRANREKRSIRGFQRVLYSFRGTCEWVASRHSQDGSIWRLFLKERGGVEGILKHRKERCDGKELHDHRRSPRQGGPASVARSHCEIVHWDH